MNYDQETDENALNLDESHSLFWKNRQERLLYHILSTLVRLFQLVLAIIMLLAIWMILSFA